MSLGITRTVTLEDERTITYRTRTVPADLSGKGTNVRVGKWCTAYVAACAAGAGTLGQRYIRCLLTGRTFDAWEEGDVDRLIPSRGYVAGNIVLVSGRGNWGRGYAQELETDIDGIEKYISLVQTATKHLPHIAPGNAGAKALYYAYGDRTKRNSRQAQSTAGPNERTLAMLEVTRYLASDAY